MTAAFDGTVDLLEGEIRRTYAAVSQNPGTDFSFPSGRPWAEDLGHAAGLADVPATTLRALRRCDERTLE